MPTKSIYRVRNWNRYNRSLINRGNLTIWVDEKSIAGWSTVKPTGRKGRVASFSDAATRVRADDSRTSWLSAASNARFFGGFVFDARITPPSAFVCDGVAARRDPQSRPKGRGPSFRRAVAQL